MTIEKKLKTDFEELYHLDEIVDVLGAEAGLDDERKAGLMLCASEAVTNGMLHGNKMDEGKTVTIHATAIPGEVRFSVRDEGSGFDPGSVPDPLNDDNLLKPSGRGVFLMKTYCDEVIYDMGGTRVTLVIKA